MSVIESYFKAKQQMKSGCPYARAIKQALNKRFGVSAFHSDLGNLIADLSHKSAVHPGSYMTCNGRSRFGFLPHRNHFFIVKEMLSPHWCRGFFCPPRIEFGEAAQMYYHPDIRRRTRIQKKKIFNPFSDALVRCRNRRFRLYKEKSYHEPMSHFPPILA